jgi:nitrile hydratase beta subunit
MGGTHGFGPVEPEPNEPVFHAEWERRVFAMSQARPVGNIDRWRFAIGHRSPTDYLSKNYYQLWLAAMEAILVERGLLSWEEMAAWHALDSPRPLKHILARDDVDQALSRGNPVVRDPGAPARFKVGDWVRARNIHPATHTRLPRYVRGRLGEIERVHGCHVFPDRNALGEGEHPQWLYTVRFEGRELWGAEADPRLKVSVDAWEPYLEQV